MKPNTVTIRDREIEVCSHGECMGPRVWDYATCWKHLKDGERSAVRGRLSDALRKGQGLARIVLSGADLSEFDFSGADLSNAHLDHCKLRKARFVEANLRYSYLGWADLEGADLTRAELHGCVFTNSNLKHVTLMGYSLSYGRIPVNLRSDLFGAGGPFSRPQIDESDPHTAEASYRALKRYFIAEADIDSASWASYCEKVMQRKCLWDKRSLRWVVSVFMAMCCGYGEKPLRVIASAASVVLAFGVIYKFLQCVAVGNIPLGWLQSIYFSFATISGFSFPDVVPLPNSFVRLLIASEAFLGILLLGLFVFTLTKRFVAR
jgi:Pentapeptide repeats (9 copies)/Ion channel